MPAAGTQRKKGTHYNDVLLDCTTSAYANFPQELMASLADIQNVRCHGRHYTDCVLVQLDKDILESMLVISQANNTWDSFTHG